jgi:hypothetical protein
MQNKKSFGRRALGRKIFSAEAGKSLAFHGAAAVMRDGKHSVDMDFHQASPRFFLLRRDFHTTFFPPRVAFLGLSTLSISAGEHNFWQHSPCVRGGYI